MREARIILPIVSLDREYTAVHKGLRRLLCQSFGGCTMTQGPGAWVDGEGNTISETVMIYDIAMADKPANTERLTLLAHNAAHELGQEAVYIRYPDGTVVIDKVGQSTRALSKLDPHGDHFPPVDPQGYLFRAQRESQGQPVDAIARPTAEAWRR